MNRERREPIFSDDPEPPVARLGAEQIWPFDRKKKEEQPYSSEEIAAAENEFEQSGTLQPNEASFYHHQDSPSSRQKTLENITQEFDYLSTTHNLETGSARVQQLQELAERMLAGEKIKFANKKLAGGNHPITPRVVIMNKGQDPNAFVFPEGSIFISQSLLNACDSLDEVAAVLAHEVRHLTLDTYGCKSDPAGVGVDWLHEVGADVTALKLLEKVGMSTAGMGILKKIAAGKRGTAHQTGESRATYVKGAHYVEDFATSGQPLTPLPVELRQEARKTNVALAQEIIAAQDAPALRELLPKLHKHDLKTAFDALHDVREQQLERGFPLQREFQDLFKAQLTLKEFSTAGSNLGLSLLYYEYLGAETLSLIENEAELTEVIDILPSISRPNHHLPPSYNTLSPRIEQMLFGKELHYIVNPTTAFTAFLHRTAFNPEHYPQKTDGTPVTKPQLVAALSRLQEQRDAQGVKTDDAYLINDGPIDYLAREYAGCHKKSTYTSQQIQVEAKAYLQACQQAGVRVYKNDIYRDDQPFFDGERKLIIPRMVFSALQRAFNEVGEEQPAEEPLRKAELVEKLHVVVENLANKKFVNLNQLLADLAEATGEFRIFEKGGKALDKMPEQDRAEVTAALLRQIDAAHFAVQESVEESLLGDGRVDLFGTKAFESEPTPESSNQRNVVRYALKQQLLLLLSRSDAEAHFYPFFHEAMAPDNLDTGALNEIQLQNLLWSLLASWDIKDHDAFMALPAVADLAQREPSQAIDSLSDIAEYIKKKFVRFKRYTLEKNSEAVTFDMFVTDIGGLIVGRQLRDKLQEQIAAGVEETDFDNLFTVLDACFSDGPEKENFLREINRRYLQNSEITLDKKTAYLQQHYDRIGVAGMATVAEQITTLPDYRRFSAAMAGRIEEYLSGSRLIASAATGDFLTSLINTEHTKLMQTTDDSPANRAKTSNSMATHWLEYYRPAFDEKQGYTERAKYEPAEKKVYLTSTSRQTFRTVADSFTSLHGLGLPERFALMHKALTDRNGALTTNKQRQAFGEQAVKAMQFDAPFINALMRSLAKKGEVETIALPLVQVMAPLLFRSLDITTVKAGVANKDGKEKILPDLYKYASKQVGDNVFGEVVGQMSNYYHIELPNKEIDAVLRSSTRAVTVSGMEYMSQPQSQLAGLARESGEQYNATADKLQEILFPNQAGGTEQVGKLNETNEQVGAMPYEGIIRAAELNPLTTRGMQVAQQLFQFEPAVEQRLSQSLDSNMTVNKLIFWYNLEKLSTNGDAGTRDFVNSLESIGDRAGAGSLFTTYFATRKNEAGEHEYIVVKVLNPNAESFVSDSYRTLDLTLGDIKQIGGWRNRDTANKAQELLDLANTWCIRDINHTNFVAQDNRFRGSIAAFNARHGADMVSAPAVVKESVRLKSEQRVVGKTLNKVLHDEQVAPQKKQELLTTFGKFFRHQLEQPAFIDEQGEEVFLLHSDPHAGNYIVEQTEGGERLSVIDRSMYLQLQRADVEVFKKLLDDDTATGFVTDFIDRLLERNKLAPIAQQSTRRSLQFHVAKEYALQKINPFKTYDDFSVLRSLLVKMTEQHIDVPLEFRLMLRNVQATKKLLQKYEVPLSATTTPNYG